MNSLNWLDLGVLGALGGWLSSCASQTDQPPLEGRLGSWAGRGYHLRSAEPLARRGRGQPL
jgi:hypothetical protein